MFRSVVYIAVLCLLSLASHIHSAQEAERQQKTAIWRVIYDMQEAFGRGDAEGVVAGYTEDIIYRPNGVDTIIGRDGIVWTICLQCGESQGGGWKWKHPCKGKNTVNLEED